MTPAALALLAIIADLGIKQGPSLEATTRYCTETFCDCLPSPRDLELIIQSYHQGYEDGACLNH